MNVYPYTSIIFAAYTTEDDRGSLLDLIGYYDEQADALAVSKGRGYYGGDGRVLSKAALSVNGQVYILETPNPVQMNVDFIKNRAELKAGAIKKIEASLSIEELQAMGLDLKNYR